MRLAAALAGARSRRTLAVGLALLVLAALFLWEVRVAVPATVDDAYITYSFSRNVARGHGAVYGHGVVVEGYSNFLWMMVIALGLWVRPDADPTRVAHLLALPFVAAMALATFRLCRERASALLSLSAVVVLLVNADVITAFQIGLETIPYTALLTLGFALYMRSLRGPQPGGRWVVPVFVAAALMRIDGFVPLGFILLFEAGRRRLVRHSRRGRAARLLGRPEPAPTSTHRNAGVPPSYAVWALPAVCLYVAWFAWRWHTYGLPLPTTYYAKSLIPKVLPGRGWRYLCDEGLSNGSYLVMPFAAILLARRSLRGAALVAFVTGHLVYVVRTGGDWMPYGRFLLPILPLTLAIVVWGGRELVDLLSRRLAPRAALWVGGAPAALLLGYMAAVTDPHLIGSPRQREKAAQAAAQVQHVSTLIAAARLLNLAMPPGARLVTDYGGVFAYYTDAAPIEMWGLCNAMIATRGGVEGVQPAFGRTCPACYPELRPEFFHVMQPITRGLDALGSHEDVVRAVWQTDTIGRYLDFHADFVAGRVMVPTENRAVFFLERRRPVTRYVPRRVAPGVEVDYPFEVGGRWSPDATAGAAGGTNLFRQ